MSRELFALSGLRFGFGMQTARLWPKQQLVLGGAVVDSNVGPEPFESGTRDVACEALTEALLSACGLPDLPVLFQGDPHFKDSEPIMQLGDTVTALLRTQVQAILNVSVRVLCGGIALDQERVRIISILSSALQLEPQQVGVAFEPGVAFPDIQSGQAIVALVHVLLLMREKGTAVRSRPSPTEEMFEAVSVGMPKEPDLPDQELPERAKQFERAVQTKLPPLPQAPPPPAGATLIVYSDGASRGNPGPSASGWVVLDAQGRLVREGGNALGVCTNNQAEYKALGEVAQLIGENLGFDFVLDLRLDSELVVKQLTGEYKVKDAELRQLVLLTMNQLMRFTSFTVRHVPRAENARADALANKALGPQG